MLNRILVVAIAVVVAPFDIVAAEPEDAKALSRRLTSEYRLAYRDFEADIRKAKTNEARLKILQASNNTINRIFKDHLKSKAIAAVLPKIARTSGIDLKPTFRGVVTGNPDDNIRATALYAMAVHLEHNRGDEKAIISYLKIVKRDFADVPYDGTTLGKAATESLYEVEHLRIGKTAPDVEGQDADGTKFRLSDYRGKVIVLRFWGDWCPFCRAMFPQERALVQRHKDKPFVLIGVNSDPRPKLKQAQEKKNLVWRSFWDGGDTAGPIAATYNVKDWPTIFVIDHTGKLRYKGSGMRDKALDNAVDKLLAELEREAATARSTRPRPPGH
jgi:peroxiredoxin